MSKSSSGSSSESGISSSESRKYMISPFPAPSSLLFSLVERGLSSSLLSVRDLRPSYICIGLPFPIRKVDLEQLVKTQDNLTAWIIGSNQVRIILQYAMIGH